MTDDRTDPADPGQSPDADHPSDASVTHQVVREARDGRSEPLHDKGRIRTAVDKVVGATDHDRTDPEPVRGWEGPLDEQQTEGGVGAQSAAAGEPDDDAPSSQHGPGSNPAPGGTQAPSSKDGPMRAQQDHT